MGEVCPGHLVRELLFLAFCSALSCYYYYYWLALLPLLLLPLLSLLASSVVVALCCRLDVTVCNFPFFLPSSLHPSLFAFVLLLVWLLYPAAIFRCPIKKKKT